MIIDSEGSVENEWNWKLTKLNVALYIKQLAMKRKEIKKTSVVFHCKVYSVNY